MNILNDTAVRQQDLYFAACQAVWNAIVFYRFREPRVWNIRKILFGMGTDYALTMEQYQYVVDRINNVLGK